MGMKKYIGFKQITEGNFYNVAMEPFVRAVSKDVEVHEGISNKYEQPVLRLYVGNDVAEVGDWLAEDVCHNFHVFKGFEVEGARFETI